uniref:Potassium transporter n=1 Tax=Eiseniibacteriota bacterium TaxID=2212470 RepID=A0A832MN63_UNCEI
MHGQDFFLQAFVYLAAAVVAVPVARRFGLGSVLGYLLAGVAIGPYGLRLVGAEGQDVMHFAEFGVVMMLFLVGLELEPSLLWRLRGPLFGMGGLQVAGTGAALGAAGIALGLPWTQALAAGLILSLSSTAIVLQSLGEKGLLRSDGGQRSFAVLLFQDLAVIPMLALLPLLAAGRAAHGAGEAHATRWVEDLAPWAQTGVVLGAVAAIVLAGQFVVRPAFRAIARTGLRELFTAAALLLVIGIALLMSLVGLSPALGTFLAGVVLANSEYRHELESDIEPFKGLLLGVFFIAVGASIDFALVAARPGEVAGVVLGLVAVKGAVLFAIGRLFRMSLDHNLMFAFALAQGGEFCFVLLSFAVQGGVLPAGLAGLLVASVALSMALTPFLMLFEERVLRPRLGTRAAPAREADAVHERNPVLIAGFGGFGSVVGRLLAANGVRATVLEADADHVEVLRRLGLRVFYGDASRHDLLHAAGAAEARLVVVAAGDSARTLDIVRTVRRHFPQARVLARAHGRSEAYELLDAGAHEVYRDTLDTALRLGCDALRHLGRRAFPAHRSAQAFRRRDEESVRALAALRHDRAAYLGEARRRIRDLEDALRADLESHDDARDAGWDPESLRREHGGG